MAKKLKPAKAKLSLADDIRASLQDALKYARGEKADVIVHRVVPTPPRRAEHALSLVCSPRSGRA